MRGTVAETLPTIGSPRALGTVRAALADAEPLVRTRAVTALINLGGEPGLANVRRLSSAR
jgi:HEAT repeat protein